MRKTIIIDVIAIFIAVVISAYAAGYASVWQHRERYFQKPATEFNAAGIME